MELFVQTAKADLSAFAPATAQKNINLETLGDVLVPVPALTEQAEVVRRVDRAHTAANTAEHEAGRALALLDRLEQAVLARAFNGELVPQDPADEPAAALLAQLRRPAVARRGRRARQALPA